jgi:TonB dependent receptor
MDPVALAVQNLLPQPRGANSTALVNNYAIPAYTNFKHTTNPSIKIDHSISPTVKISGYFSETNTNSPNANGFTQPFTTAAAQADVSRTIRVNYDQTLTPTLLFHVGAGYLWTYNPTAFPPYDPSQAPPAGIGLVGFQGNIFPALSGLSDATSGGNAIGLGGAAGFPRLLWEEKPTGNSNLTWIKNNHTFKLGLDLTLDGFVHRSPGYANGNIAFSADTTGLPATNVNPIATGRTASPGFAYASFLLGQVTSESDSGLWAARIGNRAIGMYLQDTWKVTRKLTLDYGLRYDYQTYLKETYGRLINVSFSTPNPTVQNRLGAVIFEGDGPGHCNCTYASNYPYAVGPRIGAAYQINSKTVLRIGGGLSYGPTPENAQLSYNIGQAVNVLQPGFGLTAWPSINAAGNQLAGGNPYREGNPYGNAPIVWPNFNAGQYPTPSVSFAGGVKTTLLIPSGGPLTGNFDQNMGRPSRILSWSAGLQREVRRDLVVEAAYVGNRGVWWTAPSLQTIPANAYTAQDLLNKYGININTAVTNPSTGLVSYPGQTLLTSTLASTTAINAGFATPAYPGMPLTQTVGQQLRPYPQFTAVNPFLGPPLGDTWYDSLQTKVTKRYSHGLDLQAAFTWQKEESLGANSSTSYFTPGGLAINDIFNTLQNKSISSLSQPFQLVISGSYITPRLKGDGMAMKVLSQVTRDWQLGTVLRYQSGAIIQTPGSTNNLFNVLERTNFFYALTTPDNRVAGAQQFATFANGSTDPNCKCFDPTKQLVLNPAAFQDPGPGNFGASSSYTNDYRWMRQPSEAMSFARNFKMGKEGKYNLQIRGEFQNVFNRRFYGAPAGGLFAAITTPTTTNTTPGSAAFGTITGGYGYVNSVGGLGSIPRSGQAVARFTF